MKSASTPSNGATLTFMHTLLIFIYSYFSHACSNTFIYAVGVALSEPISDYQCTLAAMVCAAGIITIYSVWCLLIPFDSVGIPASWQPTLSIPASHYMYVYLSLVFDCCSFGCFFSSVQTMSRMCVVSFNVLDDWIYVSFGKNIF